MSIKDPDDNEIVRFSTVGSLSLRIGAMLLVPVLLLLMSWGTWVTVMVFRNQQDIALLQYQMSKGVLPGYPFDLRQITPNVK